MYLLRQAGMTRRVGGPSYGRQDLGYSPGGALDSFAMATGNLLLGQAVDQECLEIVMLPPVVVFTAAAMLVLTGAAREATITGPKGQRTVPHATVCLAAAGEQLSFGPALYGFRSYLCLRADLVPERVGRSRGAFHEIATWPDAQRRLRVLRGPEHALLAHPEHFCQETWIVSPQSGATGMRLLGPPLAGESPRMISQPVADGTIQLTPSGPIVLLRQRPTIGGYPRIFNLISADLDLLAQYGPGQCLHFTEVDPAAARQLAQQRAADLAKFATTCAG
jgi:5-oxoprolinase (ATP-hydrolysing) subunit C